MKFTVGQIATMLDGVVEGDSSAVIFGPSGIEDAQAGSLTFLGNAKYTDHVYKTLATAIIVDANFKALKPLNASLIRVANVYTSLAILMEKFNSSITLRSGISSLSSVSDDALIGENTFIDDFVIIKPNVRIGSNTKIYGQVFIGDNVILGNDVTIYPGVKIYHNCEIGNHCVLHANVVIGSDGFGFARNENNNYKKIPQTGNVVIEDNVEIGSNTVIDRATIGSTVIKEGAKLDNLIQIGHNVVIGKHTVIAAQTGVAGSTQVGDTCLIGGQVGIAGHIHITDGTMIGAQSGISASVKDKNVKLWGTPALDFQSYLKSYAYFKKLPEIVLQLREVQKSLDVLKETIKIN